MIKKKNQLKSIQINAEVQTHYRKYYTLPVTILVTKVLAESESK